MTEQRHSEHNLEPYYDNEIERNSRNAGVCLFEELIPLMQATDSSVSTELSESRLVRILPRVDLVAGDFMHAALNSLSREEFQRIPASLFGSMNAREVADLSPRSMTRLTADQWLELTSSVANAARNNQLSLLCREQVQALTQEHIQAIYPWRMPYMPVEHFTNAQLTQLTREQVDALSSQQLADIGSMRLEFLFQNRNVPEGARHLLQIGPENLGALQAGRVVSTYQMRSRRTQYIGGEDLRRIFAPETLPHILPGMFRAFHQEQLRELLCEPGTTRPVPARINSLTEAQIHAIQMRRGFSNEPWSTAVRERANQFNSIDH
jgi:hypothetical protein